MLSGTIGHVAHGKSTVVKAISGVQVRFNFAMPFDSHVNVFFSFFNNVLSRHRENKLLCQQKALKILEVSSRMECGFT